MSEPPRWQIVRIQKQHNRKEFDCGNADLNTYLKQYARKNDTSGIARTFVAVDQGSLQVMGYYSARSGHVAWDTLPEDKIKRRLPRYPVPVFHLARLAVDRSAQGSGLGEMLLMHALNNAARLTEEIGIYAVEVLAVDNRAKEFYTKYGFSPLVDDQLHLYLSIKKILKVFSR